MKIFKRLRGFFQRRILRRKKKDKSDKISEGHEELDENEVSGQVGESSQGVCDQMNERIEQPYEKFENDQNKEPNPNEMKDNVNNILNEEIHFNSQKDAIFESPLPPENLKGNSKNDEGITPDSHHEDKIKENDGISEENVSFPQQKTLILNTPVHPNSLEESLKIEKRIRPERDEYKEENEAISDNCTQSPSNKIMIWDDLSSPDRQKRDFKKDRKMSPIKDAFIDCKKEISKKGVLCPLEKYMLWDGPMVEGLVETLQEGKEEKLEKLPSCDGQIEKTVKNLELPAEKSNVIDVSGNPDKNSDFEVDFEKVFGVNVKECESEDQWFHVASTEIEYLGHRLKETSYDLEYEEEIDELFDVVFNFDEKIYAEDNDAEFEICKENIHSKGQKSFKDHYDFGEEYDEYSDEETSEKKKKFAVVIRDSPAKNLAFEKHFLYSDEDNTMHLREINDPLKRKNVFRSDPTGFEHGPFWDSSKMKRFYSEGDMSRAPPDFSMAFTTTKQ